jgi:hypothetical protein
MTITIGGRELATTRPADLDALLVEATGCSATEQAQMLNKAAPFQIARALMPMLVDKPSAADLTEEIAGGDIADVIRQVKALLGAPAIVLEPLVEEAA